MNQGRFYIRTFGCQMNDSDSERIANILLHMDYAAVDDPKDADLVFLNTCSIRAKAENKIYSALGRLRPLKARKRGLVIAVGGCVAQQEGKRILAKAPYVDIVFGTQSIPRIPVMLDRVEAGQGPVIDTAFTDDYLKEPFVLSPEGTSPPCAYVTIMQGCANYCAYCVVPYLRGPEQHRPACDVLSEIRARVERGVKEVTLIGQNVNAYQDPGPETVGFSELLDQVNAVDGLERIRFTTSHPKDLGDELVKSFARLDKLCEYLHLPVQSGSDHVLAGMNRGYTRDYYLERVDRLRESCPGISFGTDVIVGFPGEEERDFRETMSLLEEVRFDVVFSFKYSARPGTGAAKMRETVPEEEKGRRLSELQDMQRSILAARNKAIEGTIVTVLAEGRDKSGAGLLSGRSRTNKVVHFRGEARLLNQVVPVRVTEGLANSLRGAVAFDTDM